MPQEAWVEVKNRSEDIPRVYMKKQAAWCFEEAYKLVENAYQ